MIFSKEEKEMGESIFGKFEYGRLHKKKWPISGFNEILKPLNKEEKILIGMILDINPRDFGKKGQFYGIKPVPKNLVLISRQKYVINGETRFVTPQYLPKNVYRAYLRLNNAMQKDLGRGLNVLSGYRSPAYQLVLFFHYLYEANWDLKKTFRRVALPGWSEHGFPARQAIDFAPQKGIALLEDFYKTEEYKWLKKNAKKYGFYLSFPPKNKLGVIFEPWHWHFKIP